LLRNGNDQQVLAAARDLEVLTTEMVLTVPQAFPAEYAIAEARCNGTRAVDTFMAAHQNNPSLQERVSMRCYYFKPNNLTYSGLLVHLRNKYLVVVPAPSLKN
jgi:hypothetical protein